LTPLITSTGVQTLLDHPALSPPSQADTDSLAAARSSGPLPAAFQGIDLLLSFAPPPSLSLLSPSFTSSGIALADTASPLGEVIKKAKPRYTFWADGEGFWEREPFGWTSEQGGKEDRFTRAVKLGALGAEGDGKKARVGGTAFSYETSNGTTQLTPVVVLRFHSTPADSINTSSCSTGQCHPQPIYSPACSSSSCGRHPYCYQRKEEGCIGRPRVSLGGRTRWQEKQKR
jgi:hypothetical protein